MIAERWIEDPDGRFRVRLPDGWERVEEGESEGVEITDAEGVGALQLLGFAGVAEPEDPADELYSFLADQDVELEEDEVEDLELPGGAMMAFTELVTEDEGDDQEGATYWLIGVALAPHVLVFTSYSCDAEDAGALREPVLAILRTLELRGGDAAGETDGPAD